NKLLEKLRGEAEQERSTVAAEESKIASHWKEAEERFEKYKEAETKKLRRERKDAEKHVALWQKLRRERKDASFEKHVALWQEIQVVQDDASRREKKLKGELERLKAKQEETHARNEEVTRELKFSEEARIAVQDREHVAQQKARAAGEAAARASDAAKAADRGGAARALPASMSAAQQQALAERIARTAVEADAEEPRLSRAAGARAGGGAGGG
ncbi:hypothetical protein T484DRAFT_1813228, partial [Baffinella frigidus]